MSSEADAVTGASSAYAGRRTPREDFRAVSSALAVPLKQWWKTRGIWWIGARFALLIAALLPSFFLLSDQSPVHEGGGLAPTNIAWLDALIYLLLVASSLCAWGLWLSLGGSMLRALQADAALGERQGVLLQPLLLFCLRSGWPVCAVQLFFSLAGLIGSQYHSAGSEPASYWAWGWSSALAANVLYPLATAALIIGLGCLLGPRAKLLWCWLGAQAALSPLAVHFYPVESLPDALRNLHWLLRGLLWSGQQSDIGFLLYIAALAVAGLLLRKRWQQSRPAGGFEPAFILPLTLLGLLLLVGLNIPAYDSLHPLRLQTFWDLPIYLAWSAGVLIFAVWLVRPAADAPDPAARGLRLRDIPGLGLFGEDDPGPAGKSYEVDFRLLSTQLAAPLRKWWAGRGIWLLLARLGLGAAVGFEARAEELFYVAARDAHAALPPALDAATLATSIIGNCIGMFFWLSLAGTLWTVLAEQRRGRRTTARLLQPLLLFTLRGGWPCLALTAALALNHRLLIHSVYAAHSKDYAWLTTALIITLKVLLTALTTAAFISCFAFLLGARSRLIWYWIVGKDAIYPLLMHLLPVNSIPNWQAALHLPSALDPWLGFALYCAIFGGVALALRRLRDQPRSAPALHPLQLLLLAQLALVFVAGAEHSLYASLWPPYIDRFWNIPLDLSWCAVLLLGAHWLLRPAEPARATYAGVAPAADPAAPAHA